MTDKLEGISADAVSWDFRADEPTPPTVRNIGSQLQLFFDEWLIEEISGAEMRLHHPQPREVALNLDRPWEGPASGVNIVVMEDDGRYRMWYVGFTEGGARNTAYAESEDGIHWERPELGIVEFAGSKNNNLVLQNATGWNLGAFKDGNPDPAYADAYKAVARGHELVDGRSTLRGLTSPDGLRWTVLDKDPIIFAPDEPHPAFDSPISSFWDAVRGHYVAYVRGVVPPGLRSIRRTVSTDFRTWSVPEYIDLGDSPTEQLYMSACTPYFRAPHVYLMFPNRYVRERTPVDGAARPGIAETVFMASRDGVHFSRRFMEAFIRPGPDTSNWYKHNMMAGVGVHPTGPAEISLYYVENHGHPSVHIRRASLRTDGFVSVGSGYGGGELLTRPVTFTGNELVVNYATSVAGTLRLELQDREGRVVDGYGLADCDEIYGDEIGRVVKWRGGSDVGALAGQPVRVRFAMTKEVDVYSMQFR